MFPPTQPIDESAALMRVSEFHRYLAEHDRDAIAGTTRLSSLNPSLLLDLQRFAAKEASAERAGTLEVLEVMAAAVRHGRALLVHLQHDYRVVPLSVYPVEHLVHTPVPLRALLGWRLTELRVLHIEPARLAPPAAHGTVAAAAADDALADEPAPRFEPLGPLLWELALRGAREELLPEIAGNAAYRVAPGADLSRLALTGTLDAAVQRLSRTTTNLREIAGWPGFDRERAMRLLNGLYLQAALMVSRSHPAATNEGWSSASAGR